MIRTLKEALQTASKNLYKKTGLHWAVIKSKHFQERFIERFSCEDLELLEKTLEKAAQKAKAGCKLKYTHPLYGITVVINKVGLNGIELVTCWKENKC